MVVEVPHAGLWIDPEALVYTLAPARSIARDADLYVDELSADVPDEGGDVARGEGEPLRGRSEPRRGRRRRRGRRGRRAHAGPARPRCGGSPRTATRCSPRRCRAASWSAASTPSTGPTTAPWRPSSSASSPTSATPSCSAPTRCRGSPARRRAPGRGSQPRRSCPGQTSCQGRGGGPARRGWSSTRWRPTEKPLVSASGTTIPTAGGSRPASTGGRRRVCMQSRSRWRAGCTWMRAHCESDAQGFRAVREFVRTLAARLALAEPDAPVRRLRREPDQPPLTTRARPGTSGPLRVVTSGPSAAEATPRRQRRAPATSAARTAGARERAGSDPPPISGTVGVRATGASAPSPAPAETTPTPAAEATPPPPPVTPVEAEAATMGRRRPEPPAARRSRWAGDPPNPAPQAPPVEAEAPPAEETPVSLPPRAIRLRAIRSSRSRRPPASSPRPPSGRRTGRSSLPRR